MDNQKIIKIVENNFKDIWKTICRDTYDPQHPDKAEDHSDERASVWTFAVSLLHDIYAEEGHNWIGAEKRARTTVERWELEVNEEK